MTDRELLISAIASVAKKWSNPDYPRRRESVSKTLEAPNKFTEESIAFSINHFTSLLTESAIKAWIASRFSNVPKKISVVHRSGVPIWDVRDMLAVLLVGHEYRGHVSDSSPFLIQDFAADLQRELDLPVTFCDLSELFQGADAAIAFTNEEEIATIVDLCERHQLPENSRLLVESRRSVSVIDGRETEEEREGLAEDVLLFEGYGSRSVAMIWSPKNLSPDRYLDSFALFRAVFPVHPSVPGSLRMQLAFLKARNQPHAYGENLEFLISKGEPEIQLPGHVRWVEYDDLEQVRSWIKEKQDKIELISTRQDIAARLKIDKPTVRPGESHRPPLDWQNAGIDIVEFLSRM